MTQRMLTTVGLIAAALLVAVLVGVFALLFARPVTAQTQGVPGMRQVTVVGHGEVKGRPDTATVQIGVQTQAPDAKDALAQNNQQTAAVQAKLKELGIEDKDIQTSNFSINSMYDNKGGQEVTGYAVSNVVSITIRNIDQAGALLDQVVQAGANNIYGINFSVSNPEELLGQARAAAVQNAQARATQLAQAGNATVGEVLVITENVGSPPPMPMMSRAAGMVADESVPVQAGEQTLSVQVQVTYALR